MNPRQKQKEEKKNRIIRAATQVFAQKGFAGTVMSDIAVQAGLGKGTLYEYFDSKEDLFFAVFQWFTDQMGTAATVRTTALGQPPSQRMLALSDSILRTGLSIKDLFSSVHGILGRGATSSPQRQKFRDSFRNVYMDLRRVVSSLIKEGIQMGEFRPDVDPEAIAAVLVGSWDGLLLQVWFEDSFDPLEVAEKFMSVLLGGLSAGVSAPHFDKTG